MEEHHVRQVKIVEALEAEKKKISNELMEIQKRRAIRENQPSRNGQFFLGERTEHIGVTIKHLFIVLELVSWPVSKCFCITDIHNLMEGHLI